VSNSETDYKDFMTGSFLVFLFLIPSLLVLFGSVRQTKLAIRQLLDAR